MGRLGGPDDARYALIAIANPLAAVPVFLSLVPAGDPKATRQAAKRVDGPPSEE
jgi:hypothetical protein